MSHAQQIFHGSLFDPRASADWVSGTISLDPLRLHFVAETARADFPLVCLQIEKEKDAGGEIIFTNPNSPQVRLSTFDEAILQAPALLNQAHTRNQIEALQSATELKRRLKITAGFIAGFALLALAVSMVLGFMVRSLVARIPPEMEQELGDSVLADLKEEEVFVDNAKLKEKLETAAAPVIAALPKAGVEYKFYVVEEPLPNAFALPGGHVVATTRLLEMTDKPEEIAAVVAHEIAHVRLKHAFRQIIASAGPYLVASVFMRGGGGLVGVLGGGSQLLVHQSFSQDYEYEADAEGWNYLVKARIDPRNLPEILKKLEQEEFAAKLRKFSSTPGAFSSHPATERRVRRLEAKWRKLKDKSAFESRAKEG